METVISIIQDKVKIGRKKLCLLVLLGCVLLGLPSTLGYGVWESVRIFGFQLLDFFDFISNSVLMPIAALLTCIFIAYVTKPAFVIEEIELNGKFKMKKLFCAMVKYIAPLCLVTILVFALFDAFGVVTI